MKAAVKEVLLEYVKSCGYKRPDFVELVGIIKSFNITNVAEFWELIDYANISWSNFRSTESLNDLM